MIAGVALLVVAGLVVVGRRRAVVDADVWLWLLAEVEARVLRGDRAAAAAVAVGALGPPAVAATVDDVIRALPADAHGGTVLGGVAVATGDPRVERLRTAVAACDHPGAPAPEAMRHLRVRERAVADGCRARRTAVGPAMAARWLLLAPLVPVAADVTGTVASLALAAGAVATWWSAGRWLAAAADVGAAGRWHR